MFKQLSKSWLALLTLIAFIVYTFWWGMIQQLDPNPQNPILDIWSNTYCFMAIWGGLWGLHISQKWGGFKSVIGKAAGFFSAGLLLQAFGQLVYTYMADVMQIEIPYPSIGDLGFFGSIFFYIAGISYLAKATGIRFRLKQLQNQIQAVLIPLLILGYSYFLFLRNYQFDWSAPLTIFLDFGYPLGQAIYISLALLTFLLSSQTLGGIMKTNIMLFLFALLIQYLADFNFLFQTYNETWVYAGYGDYLYFLAYFFMTMGLVSLQDAFNQIKQK